jgi:hypothetical protein
LVQKKSEAERIAKNLTRCINVSLRSIISSFIDILGVT